MIKVAIDNEIKISDTDSNITWVTKKYIPSQKSNGITGLRFHKVTPRIKKSFLKETAGES